jgi:phage recombination protein Bet
MSKAELAVVEKPAPIVPAVADWENKVDLIKRTVAVGATDDELALFLHQAKKTGLDPLAKQIYFIKRKNWKTGEDKGTIQTGIDGYRLVAERTGHYAGNDDPIFEMAEGAKNPQKATVTVWKLLSGVRCPFTASARWSEYFPGEKLGFMWLSKPHIMLGKCAEALALRKAFPAELSGVYTFDEMDQAGEPHINTLVGACLDCGAEIPVHDVKCSGCKKPAALPAKEMPDCESCGATVKALKGKNGSRTAEEVLAAAMKEHNRPVCGKCQIAIAKSKKAHVPPGEDYELGITDEETKSIIPGDEEPLPF